ncbi:DUF192 domain-containing protein [Candidatus Peregrinibacteria bacterium]|nr:DUF192 domain-containing protein [Candidatus Peregrinibacteria bacterium]MBI3816341.1 DUF192 domain-containing protein [Candidatus Peregrinibacteria bacterium]
MTFSPRRALIGFSIILLGAIIALWLLTPHAVSTTKSPSPALQTIQLLPPSGVPITLHVEYARSEAERRTGLMRRAAIGGDGMLFLFARPQELSFWMKDTLIPLDILFFDASGAFVSSATMPLCTADPCTLYGSSSEAQEALEAPAGFAREHGIEKGWKLMVQ